MALGILSYTQYIASVNLFLTQIADEKLYENWRVNNPDIRKVNHCSMCTL